MPGNIEKYPGTDSEVLKGIAWRYKEVYDIFLILSHVSIIGPVDFYPEYTSPDNDDELDEQWFLHDMEAFRKEMGNANWSKQPNPSKWISWYGRFSGVCTAVLLNMIHMHFGCKDVVGRKTTYSDDSMQTLLIQAVTPDWRTSKPAFALEEGTIEQWIDYFEATNLCRPDPPGETCQMERNSLERGEFPLVDNEQLETFLEFGDKIERSLEEQFAATVKSTTPHNDIVDYPSEPEATTFVRATAFGPVNLSADIPKVAQVFNNSNIYGRAQLLFKCLENEQHRLRLLATSCADRFELMNTLKADLTAKVRAVKRARDEADSWLQKTSELEAEGGGMQTLITNAECNPAMRNFLRRDHDMRLSFGGISP